VSCAPPATRARTNENKMIALGRFPSIQTKRSGKKLSGELAAENTAEQPDALVPASFQWSLKPSVYQTSYTFDPYSVTVLVFQ